MTDCIHHDEQWGFCYRIRAKISHAKPTSTIPQWQRDLAQWTNRHGFYEACDFRDFSPRKNFTCAAYLQDNQANPR